MEIRSSANFLATATASAGAGWRRCQRSNDAKSRRRRGIRSQAPRREPSPGHAAESDVAGRAVLGLALTRGRAVAQAVVRRAQVRAALDHPPRTLAVRDTA